MHINNLNVYIPTRKINTFPLCWHRTAIRVRGQGTERGATFDFFIYKLHECSGLEGAYAPPGELRWLLYCGHLAIFTSIFIYLNLIFLFMIMSHIQVFECSSKLRHSKAYFLALKVRPRAGLELVPVRSCLKAVSQRRVSTLLRSCLNAVLASSSFEMFPIGFA